MPDSLNAATGISVTLDGIFTYRKFSHSKKHPSGSVVKLSGRDTSSMFFPILLFKVTTESGITSRLITSLFNPSTTLTGYPFIVEGMITSDEVPIYS